MKFIFNLLDELFSTLFTIAWSIFVKPKRRKEFIERIREHNKKIQ